MNGLLHHLALTIKLNFRSKQALVYGYIVPLFFLLAYGSLFHNEKEPLVHELGQLLAITVLGGACFGMPTSMVSERERGVWRRYRLLPASTVFIVFSNMVARFLIVLSAALLQLGLALWVYHMPLPQHPAQLVVAFVFVCFAFLGMGLVIAMIAETVPAVQALGQSIFLPMIIIGGMGVKLSSLQRWAQHVSAFLPGRYAVEAMDACVFNTERHHGLQSASFALAALVIIGVAGCFAGGKLFRWDMGQRLSRSAKWWVAPALLSWAAVGLLAEYRGMAVAYFAPSRAIAAAVPATHPAAATSPTTSVAGVPIPADLPGDPRDAYAKGYDDGSAAARSGAVTMAVNPTINAAAPWEAVTPAQADAVTYDDLESDEGAVTPLLANLDNLDDDAKKRIEAFKDRLADWKPGDSAQELNTGQRVRNLLSVAAVGDLVQDEQESAYPYVIFEQIKADVPEKELMKVLTWIINNPAEGSVYTKVNELGIDGEANEDSVRERVTAYAKKLLIRVLGKLK